MRVTVRLYAGLRKYAPSGNAGEGFDYALPEGSTAAELLHSLGVPGNAPVVVMVHQTVVDADHPLADGDVVALFPPVAGG